MDQNELCQQSKRCFDIGSSEMMMKFMRLVNQTDGCWLWQGSKFANGYGRYGRCSYAHRFAYELFIGPIPDGLQVCHRCDIKHCVRPEHLFLGTQADNMRDARQKGRIRSGAKEHPERMQRGTQHWTHRIPSRISRGARHSETLKGKSSGERNSQAKLKWDDVRRLRAETGKSQTALGMEYGISRAAVRLILIGKNWPEGDRCNG